jgi:hypothetical protein
MDIGSFHLHAAVQVHHPLAVLVIAERLYW